MTRYFRVPGAITVGLSCAALLAACSGPSTPMPSSEEDRAPIQTEEPVHVLTRDGDVERTAIAFTYRNPRDEAVYHPNCAGPDGPWLNMQLQKRIGEEWRTVWMPALPQCLSEPVVVSAGGTYEDTMPIHLHPQDVQYMPLFNPAVDIEGTYRLVWVDLLRTYSPDRYPFGEEIPLEQRVSNPFELRR